jgi:pimeloyl-ACP methyl ester carboxylesterase
MAGGTVLARRTIRLRGGDIAYVDHGGGGEDGGVRAPVALFVHGVLVNADIWRNVIWDVADVRRCIAPDLPAHGASPAGEDADLTLNGHAAMLDELCGRLGVDQVDLVANDTGLRGALPGTRSHTDADELRRARQLPPRVVPAVRGARRGR